MTTPRKRKALSHSARESYQLCPRKHFFQYEMRLEPVEGKSSLRMGKAFSHALEYRDPARSIEGYWEGVPLHDRISDGKAELEIAQVELLAELYLKQYPDDVAPGRIWTPEFEFKSKLLGHGFLDAIIEESNGTEVSCPVHGEIRGLPGHGMLAMDGGAGGSRVRGDERGRQDAVRTPPVARALRGSDPGRNADPSRVQGQAVLQPVAPAGCHPDGEHALGADGLLQVGARVHPGEHVHGVRQEGREEPPQVQGMQPADAAPTEGKEGRCSCRRTIGVENKLLGAFWWNDAARRVLAFDNQVTAYFCALRELGRPLDRMLYRVTKKPTIRPDSRKRESLADYLARLRDRIEGDPASTFEQHELFRTEQQMDAFIEGIDDINAQVRLSRRKGAWPMSTKACTMFGGCSFLPICRDEPVEGLYRERPLPAAKPKLPRLGKVQRQVMLALHESFSGGAYAEAIAMQTSVPRARVTKVLASLYERGFAADMNTDPKCAPYWMLTDGGREVATLLNEKEG